MTYSECLLSEVLLLLCCLLLLLLLLLLFCQHLIGPQAWMDALVSHVTETVHDGILLEGLVGKPEVGRTGINMSAGSNVVNLNCLELDVKKTEQSSSLPYNTSLTSVCSAYCVRSLEPAGEHNHWASAAFA